MLIKLNLVRGLILKIRFKGLTTAVLLLASVAIATGCSEGEMLLPEEKAEAVVKKFYEYISEARIRGGNLLIREAYKLTSSKESRQGQAKFIEIVSNYPSGFLAEIVGSTIKDRHAEVTIEYKMASQFGDAYAMRAVIPLNVDEENGVWKIDFTGETDGQDLASMRRSEQAAQPGVVPAKEAKK